MQFNLKVTLNMGLNQTTHLNNCSPINPYLQLLMPAVHTYWIQDLHRYQVLHPHPQGAKGQNLLLTMNSLRRFGAAHARSVVIKIVEEVQTASIAKVLV